jgi:hypothetical protein
MLTWRPMRPISGLLRLMRTPQPTVVRARLMSARIPQGSLDTAIDGTATSPGAQSVIVFASPLTHDGNLGGRAGADGVCLAGVPIGHRMRGPASPSGATLAQNRWNVGVRLPALDFGAESRDSVGDRCRAVALLDERIGAHSRDDVPQSIF